jgi:DNA-cytosine methyltransferase
MNVGSTFSGVGGFDLGLERAGMSVVWQAEIDEWCRRVLRGHWPNAAIFTDVRDVSGALLHKGRGAAPGRPAEPDESKCERGLETVDLLRGGFPCQDLSVAGKRAGFKGERSSLFFEFARIADDLKPRWIVLENVAGLLSSAEGRDFGILLSTLAELGYGCAWRLVDARFFGVPQRRRRVFIVGCLGDNGERAVRALGAGSEGDLKASECSWQGNTESLKGGSNGSSVVITEPTAKCLTTSNQRLDSETESFVVESQTVTSAFYSTGGSQGFARTDDTCPTLKVGSSFGIGSPPAVSLKQPTVSFLTGNTKANGSNVNTEGVAYTLDRAAGQGILAPALQASGPPGTRRDDEASLVASKSSVRRLTPTECER